MKKCKRYLLQTLTLVLITTLFCINIPLIEAKNGNLMQNTIYEETGQFSYEDYQKRNNERKIEFNSYTTSMYNNHYDDPMVSSALDEEIKRLEQEGNTIEAIGYTKIYLKNDVIDNNSILVPMTTQEVEQYKLFNNSEVQPYATGTSSHSPGKNFTLYTIASFSGTNIKASSVGEYSTYTFQTSQETPTNGMFDYITLSMPSQYTLTSAKISSANYRNYKADETNNAVSYGVLLKASPSTPGYTSVKLTGTGVKNANVNAKKIISSYVHNYGRAQLSFSFSSGGLSFTISPTSKTWKISSSVTIY